MALQLSGDIAGLGKIVQVVRATDTTRTDITSTSFGDVTGMSVTITPQKADSKIMVMAVFYSRTFSSTTGAHRFLGQLTDSSNVPLSGAEDISVGPEAYSFSGTGVLYQQNVFIGWAEPNTTSAVTYKLRIRVAASTTTAGVRNDTNTGQMYAIEVAA